MMLLSGRNGATAKPHEIARLIQDECAKLVPDSAKLEELGIELVDLVGPEWAKELVQEPQAPVN